MATATVEPRFFVCLSCQKEHPWSPAIAGKMGRCKCGNRMSVPLMPDEQGRPAQIPYADDPHPSDLYDLSVNEGLDVRPSRMPLEQTLPRHRAASIALNHASSENGNAPREIDTSHLPPLRKGLKAVEEIPAKPQPIWLYLALPVVLIVGGLILTPVGAALGPDGWKNVADVAVKSYVGLLAELGFVLIAMFALSGLGRISFDEPLWRVGLKLCAVATLPGPVGQLVQNSIGEVGGSILGNFTQLALYFGIFVLLFRQALQDTLVCVLAIFSIRTLVAFVLYKVQSAMMGSAI